MSIKAQMGKKKKKQKNNAIYLLLFIIAMCNICVKKKCWKKKCWHFTERNETNTAYKEN